VWLSTADGEKKVLIVEDDASIRETLAEVLEDEDYQVLQAGHGLEALELLRGGTQPDVLLIDLMMPVMTGWQLLEVLDQDPDLQRIPVVVFSAAHEAGALRGAREVLTKPVNLDRLLGAIARHVE
jgi:two-component system response regulator CpxR